MRVSFPESAKSPAFGGYEPGFSVLAERFTSLLRDGLELGGAIAVYHRGRCVAHLWGGLADVATGTPWEPRSRIVVFSVSKGLAAMALHMAAARGRLDWSAPVASIWPGFAQGGKGSVTIRQLFNHRAGLAVVDEPLELDQCISPQHRERVCSIIERQSPAWQPDCDQGYHALSFGLYAREVFERTMGEPIGSFLRRELFEPLGSDARLGARADEEGPVATLYPPHPVTRLAKMAAALISGSSNEARLMRDTLSRDSLTRRAFGNPRTERGDLAVYNSEPVRRADFASASATSSADGLARAYLPFANEGEHEGKRYFPAASLLPIYGRQSWSSEDRVLHKPLGWSQGFLKEEVDVFSPNPESFGHAGTGGFLGWADPVAQVTVGYVTNRMDWRVRSPRCLALMRALYACEPLRMR